MNASEILQKAQEAMCSRAKERDVQEERSMKRTIEAFNALLGYELTERDGWLFMVCLKLARASTTPHGVEDDYTDGAAYFALAGESVPQEKPKRRGGERETECWSSKQDLADQDFAEIFLLKEEIEEAAKAIENASIIDFTKPLYFINGVPQPNAVEIPCTQIMPQEEWTEIQKKYIATYGEPRN